MLFLPFFHHRLVKNTIVPKTVKSILGSFGKMVLRDEEFDSLESLCCYFNREPDELKSRLHDAGFAWSEQQRQFRPIGYDS